MNTVKRWLMRNLVCRLRGHVDGELLPLFVPWTAMGGVREVGSIHCKRCGKMIGSY